MSRYRPREWHPEERPSLPGSPSFPQGRPFSMRIAYLAVGTIVTLTGGLGNALVSANLVNLQGVLGAYSTETNWLPVAYVMTNASMNLLLVKFRQQFGLRLFTELFLVLYAVVTFAHLFVNDLASAIMVRGAHGLVGGALSTLGLYYTLQAFPRRETRLRGTALSLGISQLPVPLAYIFSNDLLQFGEWRGLYMFELGLALLALACTVALKLPPGDHYKVFRRTDFLTFALFAPGVALLSVAVTFGRLLWWFDTPWVGIALATSIVLIVAAIAVEHNRTNPLLNIRWLTNGNIVRLGLAMILVRVVQSEQSVGAVAFLRLMGLNNNEMTTLFGIVVLATILGTVVAAVTVNIDHLLAPQAVALLIMALGAWIDSHTTNVTRPPQMYLSQSLLGFGGALFLGPLVISLISQVVANPSNLVSFSVMFSLNQNLGGLIGTSLIGTFQVAREKFHSSQLVGNLTALDPLVADRVQRTAGAFGRAIADPAARTRQALATLSASANREANVLAYNDVFMLIALLATLHAMWVIGRALYLRRQARLAPPAPPGPPAVPPQLTD
ncbi:MFS transporter [Massilia horti]|uniref:MFS transporter n=1 Tax=Massilia horti TaxID=2562153 RepID=A0A4Y9SS54_9BURK|nr:MFS transporter [Massilia horti]TFW27586.1 MFS transporter [Massilia horti]